jgi:hypothetical protein
MTAKRNPAKAAPAELPPVPARLEDVAGWAEQLRARRLNGDGRAAIDLAEFALAQLLGAVDKARKGATRVRLLSIGLPMVEKQLRVALQADRAEADHAIVAMRRKLEAMRAAEDALDRMH